MDRYKKGVFVVVMHIFKPIKNNTQTKIVEQCEFVDSLKNNHYAEASYILDLSRQNFVKCRLNGFTFDDAFNHVLQKYTSKLITAIQMGSLQRLYKDKL